MFMCVCTRVFAVVCLYMRVCLCDAFERNRKGRINTLLNGHLHANLISSFFYCLFHYLIHPPPTQNHQHPYIIVESMGDKSPGFNAVMFVRNFIPFLVTIVLSLYVLYSCAKNKCSTTDHLSVYIL